MRKPILAVTGDTHGEEGRFWSPEAPCNKALGEGDYLFVCGDFGYVSDDSYPERRFLRYMAEELPYTICFCDGNHENFDLLDAFELSEWKGGKVHIIRRDAVGTPKVIHLMRGQVYEIEGKKIFTFGGAYSIDKALRVPGRSWWPQEMPNEEEKKEAEKNLEAVGWKVDYILTHTAPEDTMSVYHPDHVHEMALNGFLEYIRERTEYKHWYFGHLHRDEDTWRNQTVLWFSIRNMEDNSQLGEE